MSINYVYKIQCHMTCITIKYYTEKCKFMGNELRELPARCWTRLEAVFTQFLTHKSQSQYRRQYMM